MILTPTYHGTGLVQRTSPSSSPASLSAVSAVTSYSPSQHMAVRPALALEGSRHPELKVSPPVTLYTATP